MQSFLYASFEANKMSLHQHIQHSHVLVLNLTFDLVFLEMHNSNSFLKKNCVHVTTVQNICKYQVGNVMSPDFVKYFIVKSWAI
jgi:hypothetical protein